MSMKILITGAGGFIGGFIVEEALSRGYETWAGVRKTTSREHLSDPAIRFIDFNYGNKKILTDQLLSHKGEYGAWDVRLADGLFRLRMAAEDPPDNGSGHPCLRESCGGCRYRWRAGRGTDYRHTVARACNHTGKRHVG